MRSQTPPDAGLIRVRLPDPQYYNRWIEVGHVQPLDNQNENFRLVIDDQYKDLAAQKLNDLVFYFDKGEAKPSSFMPSRSPLKFVPAVKERPRPQKRNNAVFDGRLWWDRLIYSIRWCVGGFFLILALVGLFGGDVNTSLMFAVLSASMLPPVDYFVAEKGWTFNFWRRVLFVIVMLIALSFFQ